MLHQKVLVRVESIIIKNNCLYAIPFSNQCLYVDEQCNEKEELPEIEEDVSQSVTKELETTKPSAHPVKRGRGRPRKNDPSQEDIMDPPVGKVNLITNASVNLLKTMKVALSLIFMYFSLHINVIHVDLK